MAERLLGAEALAVEAHWRFLYERCTPFGHPGAEMRALSAIDLALWDILGQASGQPIYRLLGGPVRESIPVYNTCGGPSYGAVLDGEKAPASRLAGLRRRGEGRPVAGQLVSNFAAGDLAEELVARAFPD